MSRALQITTNWDQKFPTRVWDSTHINFGHGSEISDIYVLLFCGAMDQKFLVPIFAVWGAMDQIFLIPICWVPDTDQKFLIHINFVICGAMD